MCCPRIAVFSLHHCHYIGHFTLDNTANNNTAMVELLHLLQRHGINFDSQDLSIMCLPHVLNICSKHATDDFTSTNFSSVLELSFKFPGSSLNKHTYVEALRKDPAAHAHDVVHIMHLSSLHHESFKMLIVDGNKREYWRDEEQNVTELPMLELLHKVKTRWDSRYAMAKRLWLYHQVHCDKNPCIKFHCPAGHPVVFCAARTSRYWFVEVDQSRLDHIRGLGDGPRGTSHLSYRISQH